MLDNLYEVPRGEYLVSTDRARLDLAVIHGFLTRSYWAQGIPRALVERSIEHSLPFGLYHASQQIGFARVISDTITFAYLADVFVLEAYQGRGLGKWLVACVLSHPALNPMKNWLLLTRDAHGLYRHYGFETPEDAGRVMLLVNRDAIREG